MQDVLDRPSTSVLADEFASTLGVQNVDGTADGAADGASSSKTSTDATEEVVVKQCSVKRAFARSINPDLLPHQVQRLHDYVQQTTELVSRMSRRASILVMYYVTRCLEEETETGLTLLPDFNKVKDSFWHDWLKVRLKEFPKSEFDPIVKGNIDRFLDEVKHLVGDTLGDGDALADVPKFFTQIMGHAAISFKTAFVNTQRVHFLAKLKRLCKYEAKTGPQGTSAWDVLKAVSNQSADDEWPEHLKNFVLEVRERLGLKVGDVLYDDTVTDVCTLLRFNWWMQQRFEELGQRKIRMTPIFKVSRQHVRLDATTLSMLFDYIIDPEMPPQKPDALPSVKRPMLKHFGVDDEAYQIARRVYEVDFRYRKSAEYAQQMQEYETHMQEYKEQLSKFKEENPTHFQLSRASDKPKDPMTSLNSTHPIPNTGKKKDAKDDAEWKRMVDRRKAVTDARAEIMGTPDFKERVKAYKAYEAKIHARGQRMFRKFDDRSAARGWRPSGSITTDGVAMSVTYEKIETRVVDESPPLPKKKTRKKVAASDVLKPYDDYEPNEPTVVNKLLVLGIDPGRVKISTVVCIDPDGKRHKWQLSRAQYYNDSGIRRENKRQEHRQLDMREHFAALTAAGGSLRASNSESIRRYLVVYQTCEAKWWRKVALLRAESRSKLQRFIGKRKAITRFFANVFRGANDIVLEHTSLSAVKVAYGAAGLSFSSTGRGELAVPTKGAYHDCQMVFGANNVELEAEYNTSKFFFETATTKHKQLVENIDTKGRAELTYKTFNDANGRVVMGHTSGRYAPVVPQAHQSRVHDMKRLQKERHRMRRGGSAVVEPEVNNNNDDTTRYPECRGSARSAPGRLCRQLRFCPERRMYFDARYARLGGYATYRDAGSARAIAGLACIRLSGRGRPSLFCAKRALAA